MSNTRVIIRMAKPEKNTLQKISSHFGYNLSEYIRYKLFNDNIDLETQETHYLSPADDSKHKLLSISLIYKILYLVKEVLTKQGYSSKEVSVLEQKALEYAREQREKHGYNLVENKHE